MLASQNNEIRVTPIIPYNQQLSIPESQDEQLSSSNYYTNGNNNNNKSGTSREFNEVTNMSNNYRMSSKKRLISIDSDAMGVKFVNVSSRTSFKGSGDHTRLVQNAIMEDRSENVIRIHSRRPTNSYKNSLSSHGFGSIDLSKFMPSFLP